ncbi:MAG TPA: DUF4157 domain-containing protein, partial [Anaerolineales bacterium]|nr:DUF4157 domain-containing protein [Anaerolineales bacterium]
MTDPRSAPSSSIIALQRLSGNRAVQRLLANHTVQAKLTVGPAHDQYEEEADRTAAQVMRMAEPPVQRRTPEEEEVIQAKPLAGSLSSVTQRQASEADELQKKGNERHDPEGAFEAGADVEQRLATNKGSGCPLSGGTRSFMETRFGADFSGVRVHTGPESAQLNQDLSAQAFTHGGDIYFGAGKYDPGSSAGKQLLAHELTHVVQQTGGGVQAKYAHRETPAHAPVGAFDRERVQRLASIAPMIQRHSSWEHRMLGDVEPEDLFIMGAARDFRAQADAEKKKGKKGKTEDEIAVRIINSDGSDRYITKDDILHVLNQEMDRLKVFRSAPPAAATPEAVAAMREKYQVIKEERERQEAEPSTGQKIASGLARPFKWLKNKFSGGGGGGEAEAEAEGEGVAAQRQDPQWQVRLLEIVHDKPGKSGRKVNIITYGEMNTLADDYGNVEEIKKTDPDNFYRIVQGIRQQSLFKLMGIYEEVSGKKLNSRLNPLRVGEGFEDTIGNTSRGGGVLGEVRMMNLLPFVEGK